MTGEPFGAGYAGVYDWLYADKDYAAECDLVEELMRRYAPGKVRAVLDLGCGTGGHAFPMHSRGYQVVGVDRSEGMIAQAIHKLAALPPEAASGLEFLQGELQTLKLERSFDAALMMFAVLGYQTANADVSATLAAARRHLNPGGLLIFDVWYGPAVLGQRPEERVKVLETPVGRMRRSAHPTLDEPRQLCTVRYEVSRLDRASQPEGFIEVHPMRYFFAGELEQHLTDADFALSHLSAMHDLDTLPDLTTWNVLGCARAV